MKLSISDPIVRKSIFEAYRRRCFFTGRPVTEDEMVIDHLIPKSKGGKDLFENFVLTFKDLNSGKSNKLDEELERMKWTVINVYAPRAHRIFNGLTKKIICSVIIDDEYRDVTIRRFKKSVRAECDLKLIRIDNLFWTKDKKLEILTDLNNVSINPFFELIRNIESYSNDLLEDGSDYCMDFFISKEKADLLKSIWLKVDGKYLKIVKKIEYYDKLYPDEWAYIYFTNYYVEFIKWRAEMNECLENIFNIEDHDEYTIQLRRFCSVFPQPAEYAYEI